MFGSKKNQKNRKYTQTEAAIKIQSLWKMYHQSKKFKKLIQRKKVKELISKEIIVSQRSYCQDLEFVIQKIQKPSLQIIEDEESHQIIFSNIQEIYKLHSQFLESLQKVMENYSHHSILLSQPFSNDLLNKDEFKSKYTRYCINYQKSNQLTKILVANNEGFSSLLKEIGLLNTSNSLQSYLIKPMQRLCKYKLLLANYIKNSTPDHIDYKNLEETMQIVEKLVRQTNQDVGEFLLQEQYKTYLREHEQEFKKLQNPDRKLLLTIPEVSYIDLTKDEKSVYKQIALFSDSILLISYTKSTLLKLDMLRDLPNLKYFKNLIQVISFSTYYVFEIKTQKQKEQLLKSFLKTDAYKNNVSTYVDVRMLGSQMRESIFKTYTVYIVEIQVENVVKTIYPRFKDLFRVKELVESKALQLDLPTLQKESVFGTLKSKTIEKRKLAIQQFLQKILNSSDCYEIKEIWQILDLKEYTQEQMHKKKQAQIIINLPNQQTVHVLIDRKQRIKVLKKLVGENLGLVYNSQFQIFQIRNKQSKRLMYDDQSVNEIYLAQKASFNPFKDTVQYLFTRHYYLDPEEEYTLYKNDFVRTQLQLSVIKANIRQYRLQEQLMITFMCLFAMYANLPIHEDEKVKTFIKEIGKKHYKITLPEFRTYYTQVQKMVMAEEDELVTIPFIIIKILGNSALYSCLQFQISVHHKCFKTIKGYISGLQQKMVLGIKKNSILFLTMESKHTVQMFPLFAVEIVEKHPTALVLQINNIGPALRLNTQQAFQISKLIQQYKKMQ